MLTSPFPGMDPSLVRHWAGVHARRITSISDPLQPLIDKVYETNCYDEIDYRQPLCPPLSAEDQPWFEQRLQQRASA